MDSYDLLEKSFIEVKTDLEFLLSKIMYLSDSNITVRRVTKSILTKYPDIKHNIESPDDEVHIVSLN